ncbi:MAG TPA: hypothetical protein V6D17_13155, partial [Candidatus Obscuribacterales bacterium]
MQDTEEHIKPRNRLRFDVFRHYQKFDAILFPLSMLETPYWQTLKDTIMPAVKKYQPVSVALAPQDRAQLAELAKSKDKTVSEILR